MYQKICYLLVFALLVSSCQDDETPCTEKTWYQDIDNDSFGNKNNTLESCTQPDGYVENDTDCDDTDNLITTCTTIETPCTEKTWYQDIDNDGFGNKNNTLRSCTQPDGYVENNIDCNDNNNLVHPNATEVDNGIDDNCDEIVDNTSSFIYEFTKQYFTHELTNTRIPYSFFEPKQSLNSEEEFPLIISLHGTEYFFNTEENFLSNETTGYMSLAWIEENNQQNYPAYVVAPNIHQGIIDNNNSYFGWHTESSYDFIENLLDFLINQKNIDLKRIYLTGHSVGGLGTWYIGGRLHHKIAALVPLSSAFNTGNPNFDIINEFVNNNRYENLPIWSFIHKSDADSNTSGATIHACRALFETFSNNNYEPVFTHWVGETNYNLSTTAINNYIDLDKKHFYTEYNYPCGSGECHFAMGTALREPLLFKWLFQQRKN